MGINTNHRLVVLVGAGPGLGLAIAKKFAKEDFTVALVARNKTSLQALVDEVNKLNCKAYSFPMDVCLPGEIISVFQKMHHELGDTDILIYNAASKFELKGICDIDPAKFIEDWKINCLGGLLTAQCVLPQMLKKQSGTVIFTGATAAMRGSARMASFAVGKFSQRALAQSMAREFGPLGVHVAHVIIDGQIATPAVLGHYPERPLDTFLNPDAIAEAYWNLYKQDKTAWTHEMDIRPFIEKF